MKKIDILACILGITTGFVGLAVLQIYLDIKRWKEVKRRLK